MFLAPLPVSIIVGSAFTFRTDANALPTSRYWQADINGHASMGLGSRMSGIFANSITYQVYSTPI